VVYVDSAAGVVIAKQSTIHSPGTRSGSPTCSADSERSAESSPRRGWPSAGHSGLVEHWPLEKARPARTVREAGGCLLQLAELQSIRSRGGKRAKRVFRSTRCCGCGCPGEQQN
jgi:hypothetical protein